MLRTLRSKYGLTQVEAARAAGVDVSTWSRWERGKVPVPPRSFEGVLGSLTRHHRRPVKKAVRR